MKYCVKGRFLMRSGRRSKQRNSQLACLDIDGSPEGASCPAGAWLCDDNVHRETAVNAA